MGGDGGGDGQGQFARLAFDRVVQQFRMVVDEAGIELAAAEIRIGENLLVVGGSGLHTLHAHVIQRARAAGQRLFHVGRLDADTEGLLLLTNDGELANRLMHPKYEVSKTYLATVLGEAKPDLVKRLKEGIELDDGVAKADYVQIVDVHNGQSLIRVELHEGRKHIVRRMLKEAGFPVQRLVRTKLHTVQLGDMKPGGLRALNSSELTSLYKAVEM